MEEHLFVRFEPDKLTQGRHRMQRRTCGPVNCPPFFGCPQFFGHFKTPAVRPGHHWRKGPAFIVHRDQAVHSAAQTHRPGLMAGFFNNALTGRLECFPYLLRILLVVARFGRTVGIQLLKDFRSAVQLHPLRCLSQCRSRTRNP